MNHKKKKKKKERKTGSSLTLEHRITKITPSFRIPYTRIKMFKLAAGCLGKAKKKSGRSRRGRSKRRQAKKKSSYRVTNYLRQWYNALLFLLRPCSSFDAILLTVLADLLGLYVDCSLSSPLFIKFYYLVFSFFIFFFVTPR